MTMPAFQSGFLPGEWNEKPRFKARMTRRSQMCDKDMVRLLIATGDLEVCCHTQKKQNKHKKNWCRFIF